jgi:hypothetical protein
MEMTYEMKIILDNRPKNDNKENVDFEDFSISRNPIHPYLSSTASTTHNFPSVRIPTVQVFYI